jgi:hypothetical protein
MKPVPFHELNTDENRADTNSRIRLALVQHVGFGYTVDITFHKSGQRISSPLISSFDIARKQYNEKLKEQTNLDPVWDKIKGFVGRLFA